MRSGPCWCSGRDARWTGNDRHRLDRRRPDLGASPGGQRAAALFPRPRYRRGGLSERLPEGAEELAAQWPAARSRRLADHGRAATSGSTRRAGRPSSKPLPDEDTLSDLGDAETALAERLDGAHYRDDILRLLFICCHPDLPATQQIALALRVVSGLTVEQIARAFLVERKRDGAAHHPRQGAHRQGRGAVRDARRAGARPSGSPPSPP